MFAKQVIELPNFVSHKIIGMSHEGRIFLGAQLLDKNTRLISNDRRAAYDP